MMAMRAAVIGFAVAASFAGLAANAGTARADVSLSLDQLWPALPAHDAPSMSDQLADWMTTVGIHVDEHLGALSHDALEFRIDGRRQHYYLGVHAHSGSGRLSFAMNEDVHFVDTVACIRTHLQLEIGSRAFDVELPMELQPDEYDGQRIVELRVPLLQRHW